MKRRHLLQYTRASLLATLGMGLSSSWHSYQAQAQSARSLSIQWLGHMCFLFTGNGNRFLLNPFRSIGCTAKYRPPRVAADLVLISSQLLDEGYVEVVPGNPRLLYEPGVYQFKGTSIQGIATDHDRVGGRRFGTNVVWRWTQAGINILHLGGIAAPITLEQKILMGRPDVLLLPVGGGPKSYDPQLARQAVQELNPRIVIPTQYRTAAANPAACDIVAIDEFLSLMGNTSIRRMQTDTLSLTQADLPKEGTTVMVMSYKF
ncbi:MAG: MBL fold metallo-hydrolase [Leptolyngbyaceae cyanobacterium bins.59]|nr:MBL fold metallo-hydrolase [Leptolyngbyaceae cyanobacterium bins.59]